MADCKNCGAPLSPGKFVCSYCKTRNDIDLRGIHEYTTAKPGSKRICPRCDCELRTIDLNIGEKFLIEQCEKCFGLFFDPGELEALLDRSVENAYIIDYRMIKMINSQRQVDEYGVSYIKCPVCGKLMNRISPGHRSGVIADRCRDHGIWLDGGELRHLMEWTKAGGRLLHQKAQKEKYEQKKRLEKRREREKHYRETRERQRGTAPGQSMIFSTKAKYGNSSGLDLGDLLAHVAHFFS